MYGIRRPLGSTLCLAALVASFALAGLWPQTAQAASDKKQEPYTATLSCATWATAPQGTCVVNFASVPVSKRFVVEYVSVLGYTDHASGQQLNVMLTFFSGPIAERKALRINPVLTHQATIAGEYDIDVYHASERVLAFAEGVSATTPPSGQLVVNRSTVPAVGFNTQVDVFFSGYLEDVN